MATNDSTNRIADHDTSKIKGKTKSAESTLFDGGELDGKLRELADRYVPKSLDKIEALISTTREKTVDRAIKAIAYVIFGVGIMIVGLMALVLTLLVAVRMISVYAPGPLWAWYLGFAGLFGAAGLFLSTRRISN